MLNSKYVVTHSPSLALRSPAAAWEDAELVRRGRKRLEMFFVETFKNFTPFRDSNDVLSNPYVRAISCFSAVTWTSGSLGGRKKNLARWRSTKSL